MGSSERSHDDTSLSSGVRALWFDGPERMGFAAKPDDTEGSAEETN